MMESSALDRVLSVERRLFPTEAPWTFYYGTAGFRDRSDKLDRVLFRMGLLAVLRSKVMKAAIGVVITASHNPVEDNGVKIVDPLGEMLSQGWEGHATRLVNASLSELLQALREIVEAVGCDLNAPAHVVIARDTRQSGTRLSMLAIEAAELLSAKVTDYGIMTTPQLHYAVRCINTQGRFGEPSEAGYYRKLVSSFNQLLPMGVDVMPVCIKLDGANGVGAEKVKKLLECFACDGARRVLCVQVVNDGSTGVLNQGCGADFVKSSQRGPEGMVFSEGDKCVSFDGDADRIVYFFKNKEEFRLLDGDKIAALAAGFIMECLKDLNSDLTLGVVQTAYANGSSTAYLVNTLRVSVACTMTGVKYLHHKAANYDVGIYFEANGHGTVLFSEKAIETFQKTLKDEQKSERTREVAKQLFALTQLINQAVGDAISDMLMVEVILLHRGWGCKEWDDIYQELPSRQLKVKVQDRMVVKTTDFERRCTSPPRLQEAIDQLVHGTASGRAFIRPSGTEDVVRVYAEAASQEDADALALKVGVKVHELAGGIGPLPQL